MFLMGMASCRTYVALDDRSVRRVSPGAGYGLGLAAVRCGTKGRRWLTVGR